MNAGRVGAVVVNYRSTEETVRCVGNLKAESVEEIVVVDNDAGSSCKSAVGSAFPDVKVVVPGVNLGYGAAANRGVAVLDGAARMVLVCNPDLELAPGSVGSLAAALDSRSSGPAVNDLTVKDLPPAIAGPMLISSDGSRYPSARRFPDPVTAGVHALVGLLSKQNRFSRHYRMEDGSFGRTGEPVSVDWVSGACMMARRDVFESLGGFDEGYFMYVEDVDLCRRAHEAGFGVVYVPSAEVIHRQGVSTETRPVAMALQHHRSALRYAHRTMTGSKRLLVPLAWGVLGCRALLDVVRRSGKVVRTATNKSG